MTPQEHQSWRKPILVSALLHLLLGSTLLLSLERDEPIPEDAAEAPGEVIQATSIDATELDAAQETLAVRERQREEAAREAAREAERRAAEEESARQAAAEEQRRQEEAEQQRQEEEARRQAEAEEQRRQEAEEQRRQEEEAERQRQEEEARREAEEEERRQAEEEERRRQEEEAERRQQEAEEAMRRAAEEEAERRAEAERQRRVQSLTAEYAAEVRSHVERHWIRPAEVPSDLECVVTANLIPGGDVSNVRVSQCDAPASVVRSIETAVYRAAPMPTPPEELSIREFQFVFRGD
ncbi:colicin import membrane protein [Natronospira proteinivora]|uniref:Colicin import membrane protein n=1 Tax=Natronospira proteinivora TaxID=1807133 RepID=A0ABT1G529_9GAMM|nr:colicin import membrane protein [Natronospira proteinivora]